MKGSVVKTDPSVCLIISGKLEHPVNDILRIFHTKFPPLKNIQSVILKLGRNFEVSFIFPNPCTADDAALFIQQANWELMPNVSVKLTEQRRHLWRVATLQNEHTGHIQPMLPCQRGLMLSYQMTQQVADMCASGSKPKDIIQFLTKNGQLGMITAHKVEHIRATVLSDLDTYTVRPKRNESSAQALINMLTVRKRDHGDVNWICLFIDYSPEAERLMALGEEESVKFDCMTMQTCTGDSASLAVNDTRPPANNSWLKALSNFFEDQWSGVVGMMSRQEAPPQPSAPYAQKHGSKKNPWMPHDRRIIMNGKTVLLLALLWCTTQEQLLFAKYPEVCGHDTKAQVCSSNAPWYYCVGYRENFHTYIIMRGLVNNESLAMFMFITHVAWPYLHPKKIMKCIRAHISDGKDEQLRALHSMCMRDGDSPHAKVLRCAWHIINRAMYRLFGSATRDWQRTFEKIFWIWQQQETPESLKKMYDWITSTFFTNTHVLNDMSPSDLSIVDSFVGGIWATRDQWSVAHNLELEAFDLRVNTFTESQFSVLTQHVGVSASMSAPTFVRAEDLAHLYRHNRLMLHFHRLSLKKAKAKPQNTMQTMDMSMTLVT
jgi:hypothetical protein